MKCTFCNRLPHLTFQLLTTGMHLNTSYIHFVGVILQFKPLKFLISGRWCHFTLLLEVLYVGTDNAVCLTTGESKYNYGKVVTAKLDSQHYAIIYLS